ncbi:MAG: hypothetical protein OXC05_00220 [Halieaceae bacterium]|nr:hypothetical protein [Halieaceae bacterium]
MEIVGGGKVIELGPEHEGPHEIEEHEFFQESVVLVWWDFENSIGGYHRIGHEPNWRDGPHINLFNNLFSPEWIYKNTSFVPMQDRDRFENGFGCGDACRFEFKNGQAHWTIKDTDVSAELVVSDTHPPVDIYPRGGSLGDVAPNHMEVGSTIGGSVTIKGKDYAVNGLAFRDHGWGVRIWEAFVCHRWIAGTFGPGQSILALSFMGADNVINEFGCVIRDNKLIYAKDVDVLVYLEADGLTHRGGHLKMELTTGEVMEIECEVLQKGVVTYIHGYAVVDTMCRMTCGDQVGFCDLETANNAQRGRYRPYTAINAIEKNGLHGV